MMVGTFVRCNGVLANMLPNLQVKSRDRRLVRGIVLSMNSLAADRSCTLNRSLDNRQVRRRQYIEINRRGVSHPCLERQRSDAIRVHLEGPSNYE
jgi:hypothetical protein